MDEAKMHKQNCFITLTYERTDNELHKEDLQKFFKRLRRRLEPQKIRYFACGEYGGRGGRPHYHAIIFGWFPEDAKFVTKKKGVEYYQSRTLEEVWQCRDKVREKVWNDSWQGGFVTVAKVNFRTCKYCAKYLQKLDRRYHEVAPFTVMSRKPGIGANCVSPEMLLTGMMYCQGKSLPVPKFYIDKLEQAGYNVDMLKAKREYIYRNKQGALNSETAVDSARARGEYHKRRLYKMR